MGNLQIKRVYESPEESDGYRVLVDRLWPRGESKEKAALDEWNKDITPTPELRKWFGHKPERFAEFKERYLAELNQNQAAYDFAAKVQDLLKSQNVTLLYAAHDLRINHAVILKDWLAERKSNMLS